MIKVCVNPLKKRGFESNYDRIETDPIDKLLDDAQRFESNYDRIETYMDAAKMH